MRDFIVDTQTLSYWHNIKDSRHSAVVGNAALLGQQASKLRAAPRLLVSVITLGEIEFGYIASPGRTLVDHQHYTEFVRNVLPATLDITQDTVCAYGELRAKLYDKYMPRKERKRGMRPEEITDKATAKTLGIQENDLWLCAQAIAHGMILVTNDRMRHLCEVAKLMKEPLLLQNWTVPNSAKIV